MAHLRFVLVVLVLGHALAPTARAQDTEPALVSQASEAVRRGAQDADATRALRHAQRTYWIGTRIRGRLAAGLDEARASGDHRGARCYDDKLSQVHAALRMAELRYSELERAVERGDAPQRVHIEQVMRVLRRRMVELYRHSRRCPSNVTSHEGRVRVTVTVDPPRRRSR